ncbi:uncharacterized protein A1O5_07523 [Cladophialophora psammophila CBS 110553]|uniref:Zn(2)-C6 fungal-type domain-containing protein n=1 Tax=Cladophialophora psammophila CBS 110553 TaxID=1182543 RepID=W9WMU2_9EURO|nr:uncharacterized protein A1O5_07523 [Cladophialophora psammophila CBS 110553]EXJ69487.1 hypothetical protein A1O5_07523 [Cladophialophora psammophila CBS 110553]
MVGVPGRSKACRTCRMRKKGCDQQQPSCGPCKRSKLVCGGYQRARVFVNSRPEHDQVALTSPTALLLLERSLGRTALEIKYLDFYWTTLLPNGQPFTPRAARYSTTSWTGVVQDLGQRQGLVHLALLTNALGLLGQVSGQQSTIMQGWRLYGRSLQALAKSIPAKSQEAGDGLLAASGLLAAYELIQTGEGQRLWLPGPTWLRQASGERAIILTRPPESYVEGNAHLLFVDSRLHLVYADIHRRKRSIFSSPPWKSIPWSLHPKGPRDKLLDILIEVPALLEDLEGLLGCLSGEVETKALLRQQLEERCWLYHSQLQTWSANSGSSTIAFVEDKISNGHHESSEPSSEHFAMAHLGIIYWATCNIIHEVRWYVAGNGRAGLPACIDPRLYCRKIVMLMPFLQSPSVGAFFLNIAGFPAAVAVSFLARQDPLCEVSEERRLLQKAFQGNRGTQLRNFLRTWPWRTDRETEIVSCTRRDK